VRLESDPQPSLAGGFLLFGDYNMTPSADDIQFNLRFRADQAGIREQLQRVARAEDRSMQSLLRSFVLEGLKARTDRIPTRA
jgi:Arc-like DNA binding domain